MPYRLKLTILFFMSSQIGFTQEIVETLTEYSEQIADEFEAHEGSDEAKDYEKQYQRRLKEEEQERRIGRQRVECIDCPSTKNIKNLVLRSSSLVNELNLSSSALRDLQFYNAIHTKVTSLGAIKYLERNYGVNHYDTIRLDPTNLGYKELIINRPLENTYISSLYPHEKTLFYFNQDYFIKIQVYSKAELRAAEISIYKRVNSHSSRLNQLDVSEADFELITSLNSKKSANFFDDRLNVAAEMYIDKELYKGIISYNWVNEHYGNIIFEGRNGDETHTYRVNFGTDDNFTIGFKAVFIDPNNIDPAQREDIYHDDSIWLESKLKF